MRGLILLALLVPIAALAQEAQQITVATIDGGPYAPGQEDLIRAKLKSFREGCQQGIAPWKVALDCMRDMALAADANGDFGPGVRVLVVNTAVQPQAPIISTHVLSTDELGVIETLQEACAGIINKIHPSPLSGPPDQEGVFLMSICLHDMVQSEQQRGVLPQGTLVIVPSRF